MSLGLQQSFAQEVKAGLSGESADAVAIGAITDADDAGFGGTREAEIDRADGIEVGAAVRARVPRG